MFKDRYDKEGLIIKKINDESIIDEVRNKIDQVFSKDIDYYNSLSKENFQKIAVSCQDEINNLDIQKKFYSSEKKVFDALFTNQNLLLESVVFLRAVRPSKGSQNIEHPDMHRETFYSDHSHTPYVLNLWIPIKNVNSNNTLKYVPKSHLISDKDIKIKVDENWPGTVEKYSNGHKLGFFWKPKKIISGVNFDETSKIKFKDYEYSLFSSMLIHGGAENKTEKIRFAIGFGIVPKEKLIQNKSFFAANGQDHYINMN